MINPNFNLNLFLTVILFFTSVTAIPAETSNGIDYKYMKYGFFISLVWGGKKAQMTVNEDGKCSSSFDDFADSFDVPRFADSLSSWGVEYAVITAWHCNINPLFPSATMAKWGLDSHVCKRDLLGEIIQALKAKGIAVVLYTHPRDGHDLTPDEQSKVGWAPSGNDPDWSKFDRQKWNDFTNDLYAELMDRYGKDIAAIYIDEGSVAGDSQRVVDYPRLRETIKSRNPKLLMMQNFYGNIYSCDIGNKEVYNLNPPASGWIAYAMPISCVLGKPFTWWASQPKGQNIVSANPEDIFRFTVMQAGVNTDGGGVAFGAGPYASGSWETGVDETMKKVGSYIQSISESIKGTETSPSFPTPSGTTLGQITWGVATYSPIKHKTYLHVLKAPKGKTLQLSHPLDGKKFTDAALLTNGHAVNMFQDQTGITLTLDDGDDWDRLDTVIVLTPSAH